MTLETDNLCTGKEEVCLPLSPVLLKGKSFCTDCESGGYYFFGVTESDLWLKIATAFMAVCRADKSNMLLILAAFFFFNCRITFHQDEISPKKCSLVLQFLSALFIIPTHKMQNNCTIRGKLVLTYYWNKSMFSEVRLHLVSFKENYRHKTS